MSKEIFEIEQARIVLTSGDDSLYGNAREDLRKAAEKAAKKVYLCSDIKEAIKEFLVNFFNYVENLRGLRPALCNIKSKFFGSSTSSIEVRLSTLPLYEGECILEVRIRKCLSLVLD